MKKTILLLIAIISFSSCTNWLTIEPENEIAKDKLFSSEEGFWQALNGTYTLFYHNHNADGFWQSGGLDYLVNTYVEGSTTTNGRLGNYEYRENSVDALLGSVFLDQYNIIANANTILEYLDQADNSLLSSKAYAMIKAEALALRAWLHSDLIRLWGPVPTNVDMGKRYLPYVKAVAKTSNDYSTYTDFMDAIFADLDLAESLFQEYDPILKYSNSVLNSDNITLNGYDRLEYYWRQNHMNYYAVIALKARLYLWMGDREKALEYAKKVVEAVNTDGTSKFVLGTAQMVDVSTSGKNKLNNTLPTEQMFGYYSSYFNYDQTLSTMYSPVERIDELYSSNESDFRYKMFTSYVKTNTANVTIGYCPGKYKNNQVWSPKLRLSEMYLLLMECAPIVEANTAYETFCTARGITYEEMTEATRQTMVVREFYREFITEGQLFFMNKRLNMKQTLWRSTKMSEAQYVLPTPTRESEIFN